VKIVDPGLPGAILRHLHHEAGITIFLSGVHNQELVFSRGLSQSLTKSPPFLLFQGKEMMLFPVLPFVFLD
jgi:hypothetical protein